MTIKDVAKKAGVSISTASYALNNKPNVHPETREKILRIAEELNYFPNAHAKNLKSKKSHNIGVFIYGFAGPIFSDLLEGINLELKKRNYNIVVSSGLASSVMLRERSVDAAIIFDNNISDEEVKRFARYHPVAVLDRFLEGKNIYHSMIENERLVDEFITEVLKNKKHQKIYYISGPQDSFNNQQRYKGFQNALAKYPNVKHQYIQGDFTIAKGYQIGLQLIDEANLPDFLYCANDELAIGVLKALAERRINVPTQVGVAGFDGIELSEYVMPPLTTIKIDHFEWGRQLAGFLTRILSNRNVYPLTNPLASIVNRESV